MVTTPKTKLTNTITIKLTKILSNYTTNNELIYVN